LYQLAYEVLQTRGIKGALAAKDKGGNAVSVVARMVPGVSVVMIVVMMLVVAMIVAVVVFF
jgi:hypothetical protein